MVTVTVEPVRDERPRIDACKLKTGCFEIGQPRKIVKRLEPFPARRLDIEDRSASAENALPRKTELAVIDALAHFRTALEERPHGNSQSKDAR